MNLISNAIKFTKKGSITILAKHVSSNIIKFDVIDTGVGIPEDTIP